MPEPHDHQWQDTGFAAVEDCAVPGCEAVRSEPNDKPEREWSYMDRQTGLTGDDVDEQGRLTYTTESAPVAPSYRQRELTVLFGTTAFVDVCAHCGAVVMDRELHGEWHRIIEQAKASGTAGDEHVWARHLVRLSKEVREAGDMGQVLLSGDGVSTAMPLSDRLYCIACGLDVEAAMDEGKRLLAEHSAAWETDCVSCNGRIHVGDAVRTDNGFTIHEKCS